MERQKDALLVYLEMRNRRIKLLCHLYLGFQQLIYRPYNNVFVIAILILAVGTWKSKEKLIAFIQVPDWLYSIYEYCISIIIILFSVSVLLALLEWTGKRTSQYDESCLIAAFTSAELKHSHPVLFSRKKLKGTNVSVREFYSNIPLHIWEARKPEISDSMNVHFVSPYIEYGGRHRNKGNRICIYTAPNRKNSQRGTLYDEEL